MENAMVVTQKIKNRITMCSSIFNSVTHPEELQAGKWTDICTLTFTAARDKR